MKKIYLALFAVYLVLIAPISAFAAPTPQEDAAIEHLIAAVKSSNMEFVRNGSTYNAAEAAKHIAMKYAYTKDRLSTADQFIDHVASTSSFTGQPYMIRHPDGTETPVSAWLHQELNKYRQSQKA